jgi:hypothetical protein
VELDVVSELRSGLWMSWTPMFHDVNDTSCQSHQYITFKNAATAHSSLGWELCKPKAIFVTIVDVVIQSSATLVQTPPEISKKCLLSSSKGIYMKTLLSVICIIEYTSIQIFIAGEVKSCGVKQGSKL